MNNESNMQITLKQREIEAALRQYITNSGVSLAGKTVEIGFTAGRKEAGLVADISIEDTNQAPEAPIKPVTIAAAETPAPVVQEVPKADVQEPAAPVTEGAESGPVDANVKSLFG